VDSTQVYYDKNGNLTKDASGGGGGPYVFFYDRQNQLTRIEDSSAAAVASYAYDALGRRIEKIDHKANGGSGETLHFHYDGQRVVRDRTSDGSLVRQYLWGNYIDELLLLRDNSGTEYVFAHDHLYSPVAAIATADGSVTERYEYDAYGKPYILDADYTVDGSSDIANPYLFTGRQLDTLDSGGFLIQYSRARYYDYDTGRWYHRDPLGYVDGMGLYEYVGGRPMQMLDPLGLCGLGEACLTDDDPNKISCCHGVKYNPSEHCCTDQGTLEYLGIDDFGRKCCPSKMKPVYRRREPRDVQVPPYGGHEWLEYPDPKSGEPKGRGFYPKTFNPSNLFFYADGQILDDYGARPYGEDQSTRYLACPESIQRLDYLVSLDEAFPPRWAGWNNCQTWCSTILHDTHKLPEWLYPEGF
jgi:RHS repeat-associated protein